METPSPKTGVGSLTQPHRGLSFQLHSSSGPVSSDYAEIDSLP